MTTRHSPPEGDRRAGVDVDAAGDESTPNHSPTFRQVDPDALALTGDPVWLCGYESGYRAGLGHRRNQCAVGRRQAIEEMAERWAETARKVRAGAGRPSYRELLVRRGLPDPGPVAPVPTLEQCRASWEPTAQRREVAA